MIKNIKPVFTQECALDPAQPVVVGVSGGGDSLCLLDILSKSGYPLVVACLNHSLRPEAASEVLMVQQIASALGAVFVSKTVDTKQFALQSGLSIEAAARQLRYRFLFTQAVKWEAQAVAVGHTADDQAETVLMHLLRGAGLAGLKGMEFRSWLTSWSTEIPLVRPLLNIWHREVLEYCAQHNLTPVQDATNQSPDYFRNRLRLEIIPYLEQFQPNIRQHLVRLASLLALDYQLLQNQVDTVWDALVMKQGHGYVAFNRAEFITQPIAIQRHLIRKAMLAQRTGLQDIEFEMIERARSCLESPTGHRTCDLGAGLQLRVEQEAAWVIVRDIELPGGGWPAVPTDQAVELPVPGSTSLQDGWMLQAVLYAAGDSVYQAARDDQDPYQAWFDAEMIPLPLYIRRRQPGDRIQPQGMGGKRVKISDLMINQKLPYRSRGTWPLICAGGEIIWVPACRQSQFAWPGESTRRLLQLQLIRPCEALDVD
jgi:tRNA(Ile)-lysidine synthase